jgi:hypothetical protein
MVKAAYSKGWEDAETETAGVGIWFRFVGDRVGHGFGS